MYIPPLFREDDLKTLHDFMRAHSFATLVTQQQGVPFASHLPFLLDSERGRYGVLSTHLARDNPQWHMFKEAQEVLVIFQGPHAYITPSWYEVQLSVPTWNYAAVHAYGLPHIINDERTFYEMLQVLVQTNEAGFEQPWTLQSDNDEYIRKMMRAIVYLDIEITRLEGKFKLSQNRPAGDQQRVMAALAASPSEESRNVAELMYRRMKKR
jgi:transcriptional regulator